MKPWKNNNYLGLAVLLLSSLLLSGCHMALMDPKGQVGLEERWLILTAIGLMLIVVIPVIIMTFLFAWRFRASGPHADAHYKPDFTHSNKLEVVLWGIPIVIIIILATITWRTTHQLDPYRPLTSTIKPLEIDVISLDWKWLFVYPEQGIATVNEVVFPSNVPIAFRVTSDTVMNSFFIPRLGGQIYAMAGMQTQLHLIANEAGTYPGMSAGYSGQGFSNMKFNAIATANQADFDSWVAKVKQSSQTLSSMDAFAQLAKPSENQPVTYFSAIQPDLLKQVIDKFMPMSMEPGKTMMDDQNHMNMNMSSSMPAAAISASAAPSASAGKE